jgi:hypothetical protein
MKWLFSTLLIANLGMFIWLYPQHDNASVRAMIPSDVGELRLVGEEVEPSPQSTESTQDAGDVAGQSPQGADTAASAEQTLLPPMVASSARNDSQAPQEASPEKAEEGKLSIPVCGTLGAFEKRSQAELVSVRLLAQGGKTDITAETSNDQAGYWVLIPPQKDRTAAINVAKRLEAAGVSDLWRFTSGKLAHAISLGLFRDLERAKARSDKINEMGFQSEVRPRYREKTRYWLNYHYQEQSSFQAEYWHELKTSFPDLERNERACP